MLALLRQDGLTEKVRQPFAHKVACYYGCYLTRPKAIATCARAEDPQEMDELMKAVGAEPIDWAFKVECCGAGLSVSRTESVAELSGRIVEDAVRRGAEAIVVACPMCHTNLDLRRAGDRAEPPRRSIRFPCCMSARSIGLALGLERAHPGPAPARRARAVHVAQPAPGCAARRTRRGRPCAQEQED